MSLSTKDSQRVALVTGASRGIGRAVALALAEQNIHVLLLARTQGGLEDVYDEIVTADGEATGVPMDLTDYDAIDRLGGVIAERWGKLDIFVGNAGILGPISPVAHMTPSEFEKTLAINVTSNARLIRALEPLLLASDAGRAVFLTSGAAYSTKPFWGAYSTSKAALDALVKSWANEQKNTSLKINLYSPGPVRTAMRAQAMPGENPSTLPTAEDVAPQIVSLCAPDYQETGEIISKW
ncbi:MAG: SDR family NAD(P)-dependent oxidoreductase [Alphaproteobacteria bacterium]|nr:SDR family NAD(P)-dependent oxidoreductase [Alphaproteobacteria bacterium]